MYSSVKIIARKQREKHLEILFKAFVLEVGELGSPYKIVAAAMRHVACLASPFLDVWMGTSRIAPQSQRVRDAGTDVYATLLGNRFPFVLKCDANCPVSVEA